MGHNLNFLWSQIPYGTKYTGQVHMMEEQGHYEQQDLLASMIFP